MRYSPLPSAYEGLIVFTFKLQRRSAILSFQRSAPLISRCRFLAEFLALVSVRRLSHEYQYRFVTLFKALLSLRPSRQTLL